MRASPSSCAKDRLFLSAQRTTLQDVSRSGRALVTRDIVRARILARASGETRERDLSWLDTPLPADLSADGRTLLFMKAGEGSGGTGIVYLRKTDGSAAVRLGEGNPLALSPDGRWALAATMDFTQLYLLPTGVGESRRVERGSIERYQWANFLPDGKRILFVGNEKGRPARLFLQDLEGATRKARPVTPEGVGAGYLGHVISPDGKLVTGPSPGPGFSVFPVEGGTPAQIAGLVEGEVPVQWSGDGRLLYVCRPNDLPLRVSRLELSTGRREPWKEILPDDLAGVDVIVGVTITRDGRSYAYTSGQTLSDLYLVEGLK